MKKMKKDQTIIFPKIRNTSWWFLSVFIFIFCVSGTYFLSVLMINDVQKDLIQNNRFIAFLYINEEDSSSDTDSKNLFHRMDSIIVSHNIQFEKLYILSLEESKTRIFYALKDTSSIGKPFDYSTQIQEVFLNGIVFSEIRDLYSLSPSVVLYSGNITGKLPLKEIIFSSKTVNYLPHLAGGGLAVSFLLPLLIIIFARRTKKNVIYQKQQFLEQLIFALEKSDFVKVKNLLGQNDGILFYIQDLLEKIDELKNKEMSYRESLHIQIKKMVELLQPLTEGKWDIPVDVPPGMLTPIAESINQLVAFAKGTPVKSSKELSSEENTELPEPGSQVLEEVNVVDKDESNDWLTAINESSEEIDYLVGQLDLITKVLPPMFNQIEELYESQLNQTLFSGERKDLKSLRLLETLISEKSSTVVTLHNLRKTVNELVMLQNWVSHKTGAIENN